MSAKPQTSKVVTGKVRLSYVNVFETNDKGKYSLCILIPKTDKVTLEKVKNAIEFVKTDPKSSQKWGGKWLASFNNPLRDGDTDRDLDKNPEYKGCYFVNCNSGQKPDVVDAALDKIMDKSELYSGCYGRVSINMYAYHVDGNKGIAAGLNNVQKLEDGDSLSGRARAEDDFSDNTEDFLA